MATSPAVPSTKRRLRKRHVIPAALLALLALGIGWLYWRGTVADSAPRDPRSADEGAVTQLLKEDGRTFLRSAVVVDADAAEVWKVVTDYDRQADFLPYVGQMTSSRLADGRVRLVGTAHSQLWGDWPFESVVSEQARPDQGEYCVHWDEKDVGDLTVNNGSWLVRRLGAGRTLLVYTLQVEAKRYPDFLVRNVLMSRIASIPQGVRDEVARRGPG